MFPRSAWALMVPISISMLSVGGYLIISDIIIYLFWLIGIAWLFLVWSLHLNPENAASSKLKKIEFILKLVLASFYTLFGAISLLEDNLISENWLATKTLLFGFIFWAAIMIDLRFRDLTPLLMKLIEVGSTDETESETLKVMNKTRLWVRVVYILLIITAFIGTTKFY